MPALTLGSLQRLSIVAATILVSLLALPQAATAHQSGCHRWHSCPSDTGSYVCGDLGYDSQCGAPSDPYIAPDTDDSNGEYEPDDPEVIDRADSLAKLRSSKAALARVNRVLAANENKLSRAYAALQSAAAKRERSLARLPKAQARAKLASRRYIRAKERLLKRIVVARQVVKVEQAASKRRIADWNSARVGWWIAGVLLLIGLFAQLAGVPRVRDRIEKSLWWDASDIAARALWIATGVTLLTAIAFAFIFSAEVAFDQIAAAIVSVTIIFIATTLLCRKLWSSDDEPAPTDERERSVLWIVPVLVVVSLALLFAGATLKRPPPPRLSDQTIMLATLTSKTLPSANSRMKTLHGRHKKTSATARVLNQQLRRSTRQMRFSERRIEAVGPRVASLQSRRTELAAQANEAGILVYGDD